MPEEVNRLVADRLSDVLFTTDEGACNNLINEGVSSENIKLVGNIMIDTLVQNRDLANKLDIAQVLGDNIQDSVEFKKLESFSLADFALITIHRPSNVDDKSILESLVRYFVEELSKKCQ